jgi:hypothetical protein
MFGFNNGNYRIENNGGWWQSLEHSFTPTTGKNFTLARCEREWGIGVGIMGASCIKFDFSFGIL